MGRGSRAWREEVDRSRRQSRVAQLVRSELATVIRDGAFLVKTGDRVAEVLVDVRGAARLGGSAEGDLALLDDDDDGLDFDLDLDDGDGDDDA
ncbi:ribosome-binding factor A [Aureococcus anophagefferens]|nr:ribosome-binding factor A [Aureococcus anophagefferens]